MTAQRTTRPVAGTPRQVAAALASYRKRMDRLNLRLVGVLQERARLAEEIGAFKRRAGLPLADPRRERAMLAALIRDAGPGFDTATLAGILRKILTASRRLVLGVRAAPPRR